MDTLSESISIFIPKNSLAGIIFPSRIHPYSKEFASRDYFLGVNSSPFGRICRQGLFSRGVNSSLFRRISLQGLFSQSEFIPIRKNFPPGIIFPRQIHPHTKESAGRDYFPEPNSSPYKGICRQGLFSRAEFIPTQKNSPPEMLWKYRRSPPNPRKQFQDAW